MKAVRTNNLGVKAAKKRIVVRVTIKITKTS